MNALLLRCFFAAVVMGTLSACFPCRFDDTPAVAGHVVSQASGRPVVGALVSMSRGHVSAQVRTDAHGSFRLPALHHIGLCLVGEEDWYPTGDLRIAAPGYRPYLEHSVGSPNSADGIIQEDGGIEYRRTAAELEHIHVVLTPGA